MSRVYIYVVDRDFGFAPNPFHGCCTLATCKPAIRLHAQIGDWIIGMGGTRLKATGKCVFAMSVTAAISFNDYWNAPEYTDKKPVRNGSRKMMVGDNIYYRDTVSGVWYQADSHHSNPDGSPNMHNLENDTRADRVLVSERFVYFGKAAPKVPESILASLKYKNGRNYRVFDQTKGRAIVAWIERRFGRSMGLVLSDPFDFLDSTKRYSLSHNRVI